MFQPRDILSGRRTVLMSGGLVKYFTVFDDGVEMVEEYDQKTEELVVRKWKQSSSIREGNWEYEIGTQPTVRSSELLSENNANPIFIPGDSPTQFVFRVRNIPYPTEFYQLSVDDEKQQIVLRTTNKKYFKRIDVPAMRRLGIPLLQCAINHHHEGLTLIITYEKPDAVLELEQQLKEELAKVRENAIEKEGDVGCAQQ